MLTLVRHKSAKDIFAMRVSCAELSLVVFTGIRLMLDMHVHGESFAQEHACRGTAGSTLRVTHDLGCCFHDDIYVVDLPRGDLHPGTSNTVPGVCTV